MGFSQTISELFGVPDHFCVFFVSLFGLLLELSDHPNAGGPRDCPGHTMTMRFFSTEIDGSGRPLVSGYFVSEP